MSCFIKVLRSPELCEADDPSANNKMAETWAEALVIARKMYGDVDDQGRIPVIDAMAGHKPKDPLFEAAKLLLERVCPVSGIRWHNGYVEAPAREVSIAALEPIVDAVLAVEVNPGAQAVKDLINAWKLAVSDPLPS